MTQMLFDRFELKYLLDEAQHSELRSALMERRDLVRDPFGDADGAYPISSVYFDSPQRDAYWDRVRGVPSRRKLRIRTYGSANTTAKPATFLEIKHRYSGRVAKRRARIFTQLARALTSGRAHTDSPATPGGPVIEEALRMMRDKRLEPVLAMRYHRQAFRGLDAETNLRVTLDSGIFCRHAEIGSRIRNTGFTTRLLPAGHRALEIKVSLCAPLWLADLVASIGGVQQPFSKYSMALEALAQGPRARDAGSARKPSGIAVAVTS